VESTLPATRENYAKIIVVFTDKRNEFFPDVTSATEQGIPGAQEMADSLGITRVLVAPPGIPGARAQVLREALQMALTSPALQEAAKTAKLPVDYGNAEEARKSVKGHSKGLLDYEPMVLKAIGGK
jgi:tripartite-type tricarboxylate transporter receptor subunit TctC